MGYMITYLAHLQNIYCQHLVYGFLHFEHNPTPPAIINNFVDARCWWSQLNLSKKERVGG
jgi:hypothetical protein